MSPVLEEDIKGTLFGVSTDPLCQRICAFLKFEGDILKIAPELLEQVLLHLDHLSLSQNIYY